MKGKLAAFAAIMAAVMMLAVVLVPLAGQADISSQQTLQTTGDGQGQDITYHYGSGVDRSVTVHYDGIAATEYNPEFWNGSVTGVSSQPANWVGPSTTISGISLQKTVSFWSFSSRTLTLYVEDEVTVNISGNVSFDSNDNTNTHTVTGRGSINATLTFSIGSMSVNEVFAGWSTTDGGTLDYYPGDVVPSSVTDLYAVWAEPSIYVNGLSSSFSNGDEWKVTFDTYKTITSSSITSLSIDPKVDRAHTYDHSDRMFIDIMVLGNNISYNWITTTGPCTIRSFNGSNITFATINLDGDTIFDNISLTSNLDPTNHGDNSSSGIFANGHKLILGTGIGTEATAHTRAPQVYGGGISAVTSAVMTEKEIVSADTAFTTRPDLGTFVLVHSGVYYNLVAGGANAPIGSSSGSSSVYLSTYMVLKGGVVLDTVVGGSGSGQDNTDTSIYAEASPTTTYDQGGTFIYALGIKMPGDQYHEKQVGTNIAGFLGFTLDESTIMEGGGSGRLDSSSSLSYNQIHGSTHIFLSGDSDIWDVQAGNRRGISGADFAYLEISGNAVVRHVACGTITDGNRHADMTSVDAVRIVVRDNASVASVFGAGYDTWYYPNYSTMIDAVSIDVLIKGGTVGSVYGGGYRGSITVSDGIAIEISGGTILGDVFGGGRGGLDKIMHYADGTIYGEAYLDSTGKSEVNGNITIAITGGEIRGNVYGGGESVPKLTAYSNLTLTNHPTSNITFNSAPNNVAAVNGNTSVTMSGGVVKGSIYGGGKGVLKENGTIYDQPMQVPALKGTSGSYEYVDILWNDNGVPTYDTSMSYLGYAAVSGDTSVSVSAGAVVEVNVYGGGRVGNVGGDAHVSIGASEVKTVIGGDVYGAGLGSQYSDDYGFVGSGSVTIDNGSIGGSVYGGGAYGSMNDVTGASGDVQVIIHGSDITGDVYGGGRGSATIKGQGNVNDVTMTVTYSTVKGSIYGGGAYGTSASVSAIITRCTVDGSVYGGGLGIANRVSVTGPVSLTLDATEVKGDVYGGSAYGIVDGDIAVELRGDSYAGTVYGGGLGTANVRSTGAKRSVLLDGAKVSNSVYGGSRIGVDGIAKTDGYSFVTILDAEIGSNVFGGGYRGKTWGNTYVYIGCDEKGAPSSGNIIIGLSVFGGGDVGEATSGDELFNTVLVNGDSKVVIDGTNAKLSFSHSVFGEGNSCLTDGRTVVTIRNVKGLTIQSIQRADYLHMYGSELTFTGRNSGTSSSASELYSFYAIDYMELIGGTTLTLNAPLGEVGDFFSRVSDDVLSITTSPINRVYLNEGTVFSLANSKGYGQVYGYTILSLPSIETYYGAFAYGSVDSSGGFVTEEDGMYRELQRYELTDPLCSYWCIVGAVEITTSAVLKNDPSLEDNALIVEDITAGLPMVSAGTTLLYTGGSFTPNSMGSYSLVQGTPNAQMQLAVLMGAGGGTTFNGGKGVYIPDGSSGTSVAVRADATSVTSPTIWLSVRGLNPASFGYVGTVTIQFSEVMISDSSTEDEQYVFFNTIHLSVEIYLEGETLPTSGTLGIDTVNGAGSSDMVMPPADKEGILYLESVTMNGGSAISMSSVSNREGSNGWNSSHSTWTFSADTSDRIQIGSFNGSFPSTIRFAVEGFDQSSCSYVFGFVAKFNDGTEHHFTVTVEVVSYPNVTVTFVDSRQNVTTSMQFPYGSIITSGDAPQTRGNFIGWYYDETFTRAFNYSTPLTGDITLYARYMFTVTFDEMYGGRTSTYYLPMGSSLTLDNHGSKDPVRTGYVFTGWYRDSDCLVLWDFDNDKVEDDVTLYAGWQPRGIILDFYQSHDSTEPFLTFDSTYGISLDDTFGEYLVQATTEYDSNFGAVTTGVLTWTVHATGVHTPVYSDNVITYTMVTVIDEQWHVSIHGNILYDPIEVVLESSDYGVEISPPSSFYVSPTDVSPTDRYYMITPSGAERVGYRLTGWTIVANGEFHIVGHTISIPASDIDDYLSEDRKIHLTASWERLSYMVVVMKPSGGTVFASILTEDGREYGDEYPTYYAFTAYYGDRISLSYTSESGYHFVGWMLSKDGDIDDTSSPSTTMTVRGDARVEVQISGLQNVTIRLSENGTVPLGGTVTLISGDRTYTPRQSGTSGNYGVYSVSALLGEYTLRYTDSDGDYIDIATVNVVTGGVTVSYEIVSIDVTSDPELDLGDLPAYAIPGTRVDLTVPHGYAVTKLERVYDNGHHDMGAVSYFIVPDTQSTGLTVNVSLEAAKYTIEFVIDDYKNGDQTVSFDGIPSIIITYSPDGMVYPTLPWVTLDGYDLNSLDHPTTSEYSFLGWYLDEGFMYRVQSGDAFPEENVTLHARITLRSEVIYKVEVYLQEIGGIYSKTPIVIETTELSDKYVGWRPNYPGFKEESIEYQSTVVAEGMGSITVKMERAKGTATLELKGGSVVDANGWTVSGDTATREVWFGETVELPTVTKPENMFDGWHIGNVSVSSIQVGQQFWDQENNTVSVVVTAKWTVNEYELVFRTLYGTFTNGQSRITVSVPYGAPLASYLQAQRQALIQSDTDLYLNFKGWEINQVTVADDAVMPATNMDVHATWEPKVVNITVTGDEYVSLSVSDNNLSGSDGKYVSVFDSVIDLVLLFDDGYSLSSASGASVKPVKVSNTQFRWTVPLNADNVTVGADGLSLNLEIESVESTVTVNYVINRVVAGSLFQNVPSGQEVVLRDLSGITGLYFDGWYQLGEDGSYKEVQDNKIPASTSQTTYVVYGWLEFATKPTVTINPTSLSPDNGVYKGTYDGSNHVLSATADAGVDLKALRATGLAFDIVYTITWDSAAVDSVSVISAGKYSYQLTAGAALSIEGTVADTSDQYDATVSISIEEAKVTADWDHESSYTYNGTDRISTVTAHFIGADGRRYPLTVSVNADAFRNAGEYTFTAVSSDTNHVVDNLTLELTIAKRPLTITQSNTLTYTGQALSPKFTDDRISNDRISYDLIDSKINAGTYKITSVTLSGDDKGNYEPPTGVTWRIGRVSVSDITWTVEETYTYTGQPIVPEVTAAGTDAGMQSGTDYRTSGIQGRNNVNAGTAYVLVEGIGNYSGTWTVEFQIEKQTVQVPSVDEVPYTGSQQTNPYEALAAEGGFTVSGTDVATKPGTYKVILTLTDTANREWSNRSDSIEAKWVIGEPSLAPVPGSVTLTYNGRTQTAYSDGTGYTVVSGGSGSKVGGYKVVLRVAPGYVWNIDTVDTTDKEVTWTIGKAGPITVTADSDTKKYDGSPLTNDGFTYTGTLYNRDTVEAVVSGTITNFGTATNTVVSVKVVNTAGEDVTDCYTYGTHVNGELSITKRSVTLTSASATKTYDRTVLLSETVTVGGDGFAAGEDATYKYTGGQKTVGTSYNTFDYTLNSNTLAANYDITKVEGTLTVNSVTLTIQWGTTEFKYNGKQQIPTATLNGIIDGDTVGYKTSVNGGAVNAGSYTLTISLDGPDAGNYELGGTLEASFEITKANAQIVWSGVDTTYTYDGTDRIGKIEAVFRDTSNVKNHVLTVSYDGFTQFRNAGSYTFTVDISGYSANYEITGQTEVTLTMNRETISAEQTNSLTYNGMELRPTFELKNLVEGDNVDYVIISGGSAVNAGTYTATIELTGDAAGNYHIPSPTLAARPTTVDQYRVDWVIGKLSISGASIVIGDYDEVYDANPKTPGVTVTIAGITLGPTDFILSYDNNINAGEAKVTVTATDNSNFTGSEDETFSIEKRPVSITSGSAVKEYDRTSLTSHLIAIDGFAGDHDAQIAWSGTITDVGTVYNTFTYTLIDGASADNYHVTVKYGTLEVTARSLEGATIAVAGGSWTYNGSDIEPGITSVIIQGITLYSDEYSVGYTNNRHAGTATITVSASSKNFSGSATTTFNIDPVEITDGVSIGNIADVVFTGTNITPDISATFAGSTLQKDTDYTLGYTANVNVGTVTVTVTGIGNFTGSTTLTFDITPYPVTIEWGTVTEFTYNGKTQRPSFTIRGVNVTLVGTYTVSGASDTPRNVGEYTITITGIQGNTLGNYELPTDHSKRFEILQKDVTDAKVTLAEGTWTYTGSEIEPGVSSVIIDGLTLVTVRDFTVSYEDNINAGTATVRISGTGNFTGEVTATFTIGKKVLGIDWGTVGIVYNGAEQDLDPKLCGIVGTDAVEFDYTLTSGGSTVEHVRNAGDYVYTITGLTGTDADNYGLPAECALSFTIDKATVTVGLDNTVFAYTGQYQSVKGKWSGIMKADNGLEPTFAGTLSAIDKGRYEVTVTLSGAGSENYQLSTGTLYWSIGALSLSDAAIDWVDSHEYTGSAITPTFTITVNDVLIPSSDYVTNWTNNTNAGEATLEISATSGNGSCTGSAEFTFTITPKKISAVQSGELTYNGTEQTPVFVLNGVVEKDNGCVSVTHSAKGTDAGAYEATLTLVLTGSASGNYVLSNDEVQWTIGKAKATVEWTMKDSYRYDGTDQIKSIGAVFKGVGDEMSVALGVSTQSGSVFMNAGEYVLVVDVTGYEGNYDISGAETTVTMQKRSVTLTSATADKVYDGTALTADDVIVGGDGFVDGEGATFNVTGGQTDAGSSENTFTYVLTGGATSDNYEIEESYGTLTVNKKSIDNGTVNLADGTWTYDGTEKKPDVTSVAVDGLTVDSVFAVVYEDNIHAGTATVKVTAGEDGNFTGTATGTFKIRKASITFESGSGQKVYDGTPLTVTDAPEITAGRLYGADGFSFTVTGTLTGVDSVDNTFTVVPVGDTRADDYDITYKFGTLTVSERTLSEDDFVFTPGGYKYTGSAITGTLSPSGWTPAEGDCQVSYSDNTNAGTAKVIITADGDNCTGSVEYTWTISKKVLEPVLSEGSFVYDGEEHTAELGDLSASIAQGDDLNVYLKGTVSATDAGTYHVEVAMEGSDAGNYSLNATAFTWIIEKADLGSAHVTVPDGLIHTGSAVEPDVLVELGGMTLVAGRDYTLSYADNYDAGTASVTVTAVEDGNFEGSRTVGFDIGRAHLDLVDIADLDDAVYHGSAHTPEISAEYNGSELIEGMHYTVEYHDNIEAGTATVVLRAVDGSNFTGYRHLTFDISPASVDGFGIGDVDDRVYTGSPIEPGISAVFNGAPLTEWEDYELRYADNTDAGTAIVIIEGRGNFSGVREIGFMIVPASMEDVSIAPVPDQMYTGAEVRPGITATLNGVPLVEGEDYILSYVGDTVNVTGDCVYVVAEGIGNLTGTVSIPYRIVYDGLQDITGITVNGYTGVYDGSEHIAVTVIGTMQGDKVSYSTDGTTFVSEVPTVTHVSDSCVVWVKVERPGCVPTMFGVSVTVAPAGLTVESSSVQGMYDGEPLTGHEVTVVNGQLFGDDGFIWVFTGQQTAPGSSANTFVPAALPGTEAGDYIITLVYGTLTVDQSAISESPSWVLAFILAIGIAAASYHGIMWISGGRPLEALSALASRLASAIRRE